MLLLTNMLVFVCDCDELDLVEFDFVNKRDGVDSSGTHSDWGDRIRSAVSAVEHCTAWLACRTTLSHSHCFHHSVLFFSSMQHLSPSPS